MENNFDKKLLDKIKEEKLSPKPRWYFIFSNYFFWSLGILCLIIGSISVSVIIYLINNNDWEIFSQVKKSWTELLLLNLPYFWLILMLIFILIIYYDLNHTKRGYRYSFLIILTSSTLASIIFGVLLFKVGFSQYLDDVLGEKAPFYREIFNPQMNFWDQPKEGRLMGLIISIVNENNFSIIDLKKNEWLVNLDEDLPYHREFIIIGQPIRILCDIKDENLCNAIRLMPLGPGKGMFKRKHIISEDEFQPMPIIPNF